MSDSPHDLTPPEITPAATHLDNILKLFSLKKLRAMIPTPKASILPSQTRSGRSLTLVVSAMCYLAVLAIIANVIIDKSVSTWTADISRQITVQLKPLEGVEMERQIEEARTVLTATNGVVSTSVISKDTSIKLLEPWLGEGALLVDLPIPRLISVIIDEKNPPDFNTLSQALNASVNGATLDTHKHWQGQIIRSAQAFKTISLGILLLISATTISIIIFATRAAIASNQEVISVLHLVGAHDNFIAGQVQSRFFLIGLKAGLVAVFFGALTYILLGTFFAEYFGVNAGTSLTSFLIGPASLGLYGVLSLFIVPLATVIICYITSRIVVLRLLSGVL